MAGRRRTGQGRMDASVDHFAQMGYNRADVRKIINGLLKVDVYGKKGWPLLEDNCYQVVQEALFEKQEEEEKLQLQQQQEGEPLVVQEALFEEQEQEEMLQLQQQQEEEEGQVMQLQQEEEEEEEEQPQMMQLEQQQEEEPQEQQQEEDDDEDQEALSEKQEQEEMLQLQQQEEEETQYVQEEQQLEEGDEDQQQEAAMMGAPSENDMSIVKVHDEVACETALAVLQTEEDVIAMIIDPPAAEAASPHPEATGSGRPRRPCYGWISESESDSDYEEFLASRNRSCMYQVQEETFLKGSGSVGGM